MKVATKDYIIKTVYRTNTLPVISKCNTSCIFCSHKYNLDGVETFRMPELSLGDFAEIIGFLSPARKIVIGESATRIVEGEPFLYKDILPLLRIIRDTFKRTTIQITTNGTLLNEEVVEYLKDLGNIELNISLNCVNPEKRLTVLGNKACRDIAEKIRLLKNKLEFSGSCVVIPDLVDYAEIEEVVSLLESNGAQTVRVFLPGYTRKAFKDIFLRDIYEQTKGYVNDLRNKHSLPIIIEPAFMTDLKGVIDGVIQNSPSAYAGLRHGDIITAVNGQEVKTRVEAFDLAYRSKDPIVTILRDGNSSEIKLKKPKNASPGFVVLFDVAPGTEQLIRNTVKRYRAAKVLFITSELAFNLIKQYLECFEFDFEYEVILARNEFFGGTIKCAGLLTVDDISLCIKEYFKTGNKPELIMLPSIIFDFEKRDILGKSIKDIEKLFEIPADII